MLQSAVKTWKGNSEKSIVWLLIGACMDSQVWSSLIICLFIGICMDVVVFMLIIVVWPRFGEPLQF